MFWMTEGAVDGMKSPFPLSSPSSMSTLDLRFSSNSDGAAADSQRPLDQSSKCTRPTNEKQARRREGRSWQFADWEPSFPPLPPPSLPLRLTKVFILSLVPLSLSFCLSLFLSFSLSLSLSLSLSVFLPYRWPPRS